MKHSILTLIKGNLKEERVKGVKGLNELYKYTTEDGKNYFIIGYGSSIAIMPC